MGRTIEQLEKENWGDPGSAGSALVERCLSLRRKPVNQFSVEDLRLMISQDIGTKFLVPYALDLLEFQPLAEGDCYPGDLLVCLLTLRSDYWPAYRGQLARAVCIAKHGLRAVEHRGGTFLFNRKLQRDLRNFIWQHERMADNSLPIANYEQN